MKGIIKKYSHPQHYGIISAEDGQDYYFSSSDLSMQSTPFVGLEVYFGVNHYGPRRQAVDICINSERKPLKSPFILIGDIRIRLSNIKMYRIVTQNGDHNDYQYHRSLRELIVETFQGDVYRFSETEGINIDLKCRELDDTLCH